MRAKPRKTRSQPRRRDIGSVSNFNSGKPAQDDCLGLCEIGHHDRLSIVSETPKSTAYAGLMESRQTAIQTECFKRNGQDLPLDEILKLQVVKLGSRQAPLHVPKGQSYKSGANSSQRLRAWQSIHWIPRLQLFPKSLQLRGAVRRYEEPHRMTQSWHLRLLGSYDRRQPRRWTDSTPDHVCQAAAMFYRIADAHSRSVESMNGRSNVGSHLVDDHYEDRDL
ncbi:hypothetical protein ACVWW6_002830 [Bradyrhizobium sp. USDA 3311]